MTNEYINRLASITASEGRETREYAIASAIIRHTAVLRHWRLSLERIRTDNKRIEDMNIGSRLRLRLANPALASKIYG